MNKIAILTLTIQFINSFAQNYLERGDKYFHHNNFKQAIAYYEKESTNPDTLYSLKAKELLAVTNIKINDYDAAQKWIDQLISIKPNNLNYQFLKADISLRLKQYENAKKYFLLHHNNTHLDESLLKSKFCDSLLKEGFNLSGQYEVSEFKPANTEKRDFSAMIHGDSVFFISDRESNSYQNKGVIKNKYSIPHLDFYVTKFNSNTNDYSSLNAESYFDFKTGHHEGPLAFTDSGNTILFTRTHKGIKYPNQSVNPLNIYTSHKVENKWSEATNSFNMNDPEYSTGHPTVSADGKTIIFFSDAGSNFSNANLYIGKYNPLTNNWGEFRPLGNHINSNKNELYPFLDQNMNLYFASDGHPGYGGLDIFVAKYNKDKDDWEKPVNLKTPLNSEYDDFSYFEYNKSGSGFITSNRLGGTGAEDIYVFTKNVTHLNLDHNIVKISKSTFFNGIITSYISNGKIEANNNHPHYSILTLPENDSTYTAIQEKNGIEENRIHFILEKPTDETKYGVKINSTEKDLDLNGKYNPNNVKTKFTKLYVFENDVLIDTVLTQKDDTYNYYCKANTDYRFVKLDSIPKDLKPKYLKLLIQNSKGDFINNVDIKITKNNKTFLTFRTEQENVIRVPNYSQLNINFSKKYHLNCDTSVNIKLAAVQDTFILKTILKEIPSYIINANVYEIYKNEKQGIKNVDVEFHYKGKVIDQSYSYDNGNIEIKGFPNEFINLTLNKKGYIGIDTSFILDTSKVKNLSFELKRITEGSTVQLKEIYFDYNKATLKLESETNLLKIAKFLKSNPNIKIELASHTDSRGNPKYNLDLSQKRADAVFKFLVKHGVNSHKLVAKGYGSTRPIISNAQSEEEHQANRRTEIKILEADRNQHSEFKFRIVIKTSEKPIDTSDPIFEKYPLLKSSTTETGDMIYFLGNYDTVQELSQKWIEIKEKETGNVYIEKLVKNTVIEKITNIETLKH